MIRLQRISLLGLLLFIVSCKPQKPQWEATYLLPLVNTSLKVSDIVADSLIREESDQSLTLVHRNKLEDIRLDSIVKVSNNAYAQTAKLSDVALSDVIFDADITLGMIANNWPYWGPLVIAQNGSVMILPDVTGMTSGPHPTSIQNSFDQATFSHGFMDISLHNEFPAAVANLDYEIKNASGSIFLVHSFPYVASGDTAYATIDLTGRTLESAINASLLNMDYMGNNQIVSIDTSKALDITITLREMKIQSATAIFPAQTVVDDKVYTYIAPGTAELKHATLNAGNVRIEVVSTAQETVYFNYKIPGASKDGVSFETNTVIPPATPGSNVQVDFNYDFAGYDLDLTGPDQLETNLLYSELKGTIDSTGQMVTITEDDSLRVSLYLEDIVVASAEGYLGSTDFQVGPKSFDFKLFKKVVSGSIELESAATNFTIENGLGVSAVLTMQQLVAKNSKSGQQVDLAGSILSQPVTIDAATADPLTASFNEFRLDGQNSNIANMINVMPDRLEYQFSLSINDGIDSASSSFTDFFDINSVVSSSVDIEMPLSIRANQLHLRDTAMLSPEVLLDFDGVDEGDLHFIVYNGFPLSTSFQVDFVSASGNTLLSFVSEDDISAAPVTNGRVMTPITDMLSFPIGTEEIEQMASAEFIVFSAIFQTAGSEMLKIYSDYQLGVVVTGELKYTNK